jgi:putative SOS response-associated peptidase YedK
VAQRFGLGEIAEMLPRFNIAPGQPIAVVRERPDTGERELVFPRWGLVPSWAADPSKGNHPINARSETVATRPTFRRPFQARRCLIVADGFYEWQRTDGAKQPYLIGFGDHRPFGIAGLWERWDRGDTPIESCTLLTTTANDLMMPIHDRMPVILPPTDYALWLDPQCHDTARLTQMLRPCPSEDMLAYRVSTVVNNARNEVPACVEPAADKPDPPDLFS